MKTKHLFITLIGLLVVGCGGSGSSTPPINIVPNISAIPDLDTVANEKTAPIAFTVTAGDVSNLRIAASSDNQAVVSDSGLELEGRGSDRSLTVTPVVDILGDAFVTIIVSDQAGMSASTTFLLTVVPQQESVQQFVRMAFAAGVDSEPVLINAVSFIQDASNDNFADLLAQ